MEKISGYESASKLVNFANTYWEKMSDPEKLELIRNIMRFKLSPSQREDMFIATADPKWLDIVPPPKFYFCYLMARNLPEGNSNRRMSIQIMEDLIPLTGFDHCTKSAIVNALLFLYSLERTEKVWREIVRLCNTFMEFKKVYEETGMKEALEILLTFCEEKKGRRWKSILSIAKPEHLEYIQNVQI